MKNVRFKKLTAWLLCAVLAASCLSVPARAADESLPAESASGTLPEQVSNLSPENLPVAADPAHSPIPNLTENESGQHESGQAPPAENEEGSGEPAEGEEGPALPGEGEEGPGLPDEDEEGSGLPAEGGEGSGEPAEGEEPPEGPAPLSAPDKLAAPAPLSAPGNLGAPAPLGAPSQSDPYFDIYWLPVSSGNTSYSEPSGSDHPTLAVSSPSGDGYASTSGGFKLKAQVEFSTGTTASAKPMVPGDIRIILPRYFHEEWDWDGDGVTTKNISTPTVGVGQKSNKTGKGFWYYYASLNEETGEYTANGSGDYLVLENYETLKDVLTFTCEVEYYYSPSSVDINKTHELKALFIAEEADGSPRQVTVANDRLRSRVTTSSHLSSVSKSLAKKNNGQNTIAYSSWQESWGDFADSGLDAATEEAGGYVYIPWNIYVRVTQSEGSSSYPNQPFYLYVAQENSGVNGVSLSNGKTVNGNGQGTIVAMETWRTWSTSSTSEYHDFHTRKFFEESVSSTGERNYDFSDYQNGARGAGGSGEFLLGNMYGSFGSQGSYYGGSSNFGSDSGSYRTGVVIAYPKEYIDSMQGDASRISDYLTNQVTVTKVPYDGSAAQSLTAQAADRYERIDFVYDPGPWGFQKYHTSGPNNVINQGVPAEDGGGYNDSDVTLSTITGAQWALKSDNLVQLQTYSAGTSNNLPTSHADKDYIVLWGLTLQDRTLTDGKFQYSSISDFGQVPYSLEIEDDILILNDTLLEAGDYEIVHASYVYGERTPDPDNDYATKAVPAEEHALPDVYVRYEVNGEWEPYASQVPKGQRVSFTANDDGVLPIGVKYVWESTAYSARARVDLAIRLNPTARVKGAMARNSGVFDPRLTNIASFIVRDIDGRVWNTDDEESLLQTGYMKDIVRAHDLADGLPAGEYYIHDRTYQYLADLDMDTTFTKSASTSNNASSQTSTGSYTLRSYQTLTFHTDDAPALLEKLDALGYKYGQKKITFYDLLPSGASLNVSSLSATYYSKGNSTLSPSVSGAIAGYTTIDNFHGSGQTLLVVNVAFPDGQDPNWGRQWDSETGILNLGTDVVLSFSCNYDWNDLAFYYKSGSTVYNQAAVEIPGSGDGTRDNARDAAGGRGQYVLERYKDIMTNLHDADGGSASGKDMYYDYDSHSFTFVASSLTGYSKMVKAESEPSYRTDSAVMPDESYSYRLRFAADNATKAKDIKMYDVLEQAFVEPAYMEADSHQEKWALTERYWQGSFDHVDVSAAEKLGVNVKVYYSTFDRTEMQTGLNKVKSNYATNPYADLSNASYWKGPYAAAQINALSAAEKEKISAIAFDCSKQKDNSDFVLEYKADGSAVLMLYIYMTGPDKDEIENGWDNKGSYVDPEYVYAYNNSFLSASSSAADTSFYSTPAARMSAGTTVRTYEPTPPIYKAEERTAVPDGSDWAGCYDENDDPENNSVSFESRDEIIKYTISTKVPILGTDAGGQNEKNTFSVYDNLVRELDFASRSQVRIEMGMKDGIHNYFLYDYEASPRGYMWLEGEESSFNSLEELPYGINLRLSDYILNFQLGYNAEERTDEEGNIIPVYDRVNEFAGQPLSITFFAKIRAGASLASYSDGKIPNTARYTIPNHLGSNSNTVYLDVPPEEPPVPYKTLRLTDESGNTVDEEAQVFYVVNKESGEKQTDEKGLPLRVMILTGEDGETTLTDALGKPYMLPDGCEIRTAQTMNNMAQIIEYTVHSQIPAGAAPFILSDQVVSALSIIPESIRIRIHGEAEVGGFEKITYWRRYNADTGENEIVTEEPPADEPGWRLWYEEYNRILNEDGTVSSRMLPIDRVFDYADLGRISSGDGFAFELSDRAWTMNMALSFINQYGDYYVGSTTGPQERQVWNSTLQEYETVIEDAIIPGEYGSRSYATPSDFGLAGLKVDISFNAIIREGADLTRYSTETGIEIPNTANYRFGSNPAQNTNTVYIEIPEVDKKVNGRMEAVLANRDDIFTYRIGAIIPSVNRDPEIGEVQTLTKAILSDTLEDVLEFVRQDEVLFLIDGVEQDTSVIRFEGQTIIVDLMNASEEFPARYAAVEFKARIKPSVTPGQLQKYVTGAGAPQIPNQSELHIIIGNNPETVRRSEPVTVTPPPLEKKVNGKDHENLTAREEFFTYTVTGWMPERDMEDKEVDSYLLSDTLADVLEFADPEKTVVTIDGREVVAGIIREGQTITVSFTKEQIASSARNTVTLSFNAKVKAGADLKPYLTEDKILVPNTAEYIINHDPAVKSNTVTVTPPDKEPPIEKKVNGKLHDNLPASDSVFVYTVSALIPEASKSFALFDTLEKVLTFADTASASLTAEGKKTDAVISVSGQTITALLEGKALKELWGKTVTLQFAAKIKPGADLTPYRADGSVKIPNTASYEFETASGQKFTKESNPVTVTPPPSKPGSVPDMGDESILPLWLVLFALSSAAFVSLSRRRKYM